MNKNPKKFKNVRTKKYKINIARNISSRDLGGGGGGGGASTR